MKMRKSLALTTILMVVLLIVALSTATFAWFSASNVVNIASLTFTASARNGTDGGGDDTGALKLTWVENATDENLLGTITILGGNNMQPMIPLHAPTVTTTYADFTGQGSFYTATQSTAQGVTFYASNPIAATPFTCLNPDDLTQKTFYVHNTGAFTMEVTLGYGMSEYNASALRVAVFVNGYYVGTMRRGDLHYGSITRGATVSEQDSVPYVEGEEIRFYIDANSAASLNLVAWFDGVILNDSGAVRDAGLDNITFRGAFVSQG